jgi:hypothetical protein
MTHLGHDPRMDGDFEFKCSRLRFTESYPRLSPVVEFQTGSFEHLAKAVDWCVGGFSRHVRNE